MAYENAHGSCVRPVRHRCARLSTGVRIHFLQGGEGGPGVPILFLHGFPDLSLSWLQQICAVGEAGHLSIAPDLRGYGRSSAPLGVDSYSSEAVVGDVVSLLELLGCSRVSVVGHDWGGAVAWHLAARHPELVHSVSILNCPHPVTFSRALRSRASQRARSWYMYAFQAPLLPEALLSARRFYALRQCMEKETVAPAPPALVARYVDLFQRSGFRGPINFYRAMFRRLWVMPLTPIACPVLVIWGCGDPHLESAMAEPPPELVTNVRVIRLQEAKHWVHWDAPSEVSRLLLNFLSERTTSHASSL